MSGGWGGVGELLTPIGLALWIQDDGYRSGNALVLCTECFTKSEVELLISVLRDNFGLASNIQELSLPRTSV